MPAGAARNALDCALWDLEAKRSGVPAHVARRHRPAARRSRRPTRSASASPRDDGRGGRQGERSADPQGQARRAGRRSRAHRRGPARAAPGATLIVDANEGWTEDNLDAHLAACAEAGFALIEQPLPAAEDEMLRGRAATVPLCADESVHDRDGLDRLVGLYDAVNIKLDKTGGLTEALALAERPSGRGFAMMVGCMLGTSLAMAPALLLAPRARFVDLDGPLAPRPRPRAPASATRAASSIRLPRRFGGERGRLVAPGARRRSPPPPSGTMARKTSGPGGAESEAAQPPWRSPWRTRARTPSPLRPPARRLPARAAQARPSCRDASRRRSGHAAPARCTSRQAPGRPRAR